MLTRAQGARALVLRAIPYGESDVVVHLLVEGRGRLAAFARGARNSARRFRGALQPFNLIEAMLAERRGADLSSLHEASILEGWPPLRDDLSRLAHAGYAAELVHDLTLEGVAADALFELLCSFFARLCAAAPTSSRLRALELLALEAAGLSPELSCCARCGAELAPGQAAFDPAAGGLACPRCVSPGALPLTHGARLLMQQLQRGGLEAADAPLSADGSGRPADARGFEEAARQAAPALTAFLGHHLGRRLRSAGFIVDVSAPR